MSQLSVYQTNNQQELVELSGLKDWATRMLPQTSTLRQLIANLPPTMPRREALATMAVYAQLLQQELKTH